MKIIISLLQIFLLLMPAAAIAEDVYFKKGSIEIGFQGGYNDLSIKTTSTAPSQRVEFYYADLNASYYVFDNLSLGFGTVWLYVPPVIGVKLSAVGLEGNLRYHYQAHKNFIPYIGAHAATYFTRASALGVTAKDTSNSYGFHGGFKIPINNNVYFDAQIKWTQYNLPANFIADLKSTQVLLGLKIKL